MSDLIPVIFDVEENITITNKWLPVAYSAFTFAIWTIGNTIDGVEVPLNVRTSELDGKMCKSEKVKICYLCSGTVSFIATGGCHLFCSALPIRSA